MLQHFIEFYGEQLIPMLYSGEKLVGTTYEVPVRYRLDETRIMEREGCYGYRLYDRSVVFCTDDGEPLTWVREDNFSTYVEETKTLACYDDLFHDKIVQYKNIERLVGEKKNFSPMFYWSDEVLDEREIFQKYKSTYNREIINIKREREQCMQSLTDEELKIFKVHPDHYAIRFDGLYPLEPGDKVIGKDGVIFTESLLDEKK